MLLSHKKLYVVPHMFLPLHCPKCVYNMHLGESQVQILVDIIVAHILLSYGSRF